MATNHLSRRTFITGAAAATGMVAFSIWPVDTLAQDPVVDGVSAGYPQVAQFD